jgi:hypothetical protein
MKATPHVIMVFVRHTATPAFISFLACQLSGVTATLQPFSPNSA